MSRLLYRLSSAAIQQPPGVRGLAPGRGSGGLAPSVIASDAGPRFSWTDVARLRAPIRNRTVDLLLTMETLYRLSYWGGASLDESTHSLGWWRNRVCLGQQGEHGLVTQAVRLGGAGLQPGLEPALGQRPGDQVALRDVAAHRRQLVAGDVLLDALGHHGQPERVAELHDRADHGEVSEIGAHPE